MVAIALENGQDKVAIVLQATQRGASHRGYDARGSGEREWI